MHHKGRVYPSDEELVIFCDVAGNEHRPITVESWNEGIAHGILQWKRRFSEGIECAYTIVRLLRSMRIREGDHRASYH